MTPRHPIFMPRLGWLVAPLVAFVGLLAVLTLVNGSSAPTVPPPVGDGSGSLAARGDTAALIDGLRKAARATPGDAEAQTALGDAYYQRSRETGDPRFYRLAQNAYDSALAADPASAPALSGLATVALARHDFTGGLRLARRARAASPGEVAPYAALVDALIETGRYRAAGRALERMVALKPNLAAYTRISYFRELRGDLDGAARAMRLAISAGAGTSEGTAFVRSLLGDLEANRGHEAAAERAYREALAVDPKFGAARTGLALLDAGRGRFGEAIRQLRGQIGSPPSPDALTELGEVEEAAGRLEAARRHYAAAATRERRLLEQGSNVDAGLTLFEAEHGKPARAVALGRRAWSAAPSVSSADAYSWALYRAGRIEAAERLSAEAMRLGSRDPEFLYHAGMIARRAGRLDSARRFLGTLVAQAPRWSPLYAPRARRALRELR
jgi:tetratricopeptide (TPR) repeat protein